MERSSWSPARITVDGAHVAHCGVERSDDGEAAAASTATAASESRVIRLKRFWERESNSRETSLPSVGEFPCIDGEVIGGCAGPTARRPTPEATSQQVLPQLLRFDGGVQEAEGARLDVAQQVSGLRHQDRAHGVADRAISSRWGRHSRSSGESGLAKTASLVQGQDRDRGGQLDRPEITSQATPRGAEAKSQGIGGIAYSTTCASRRATRWQTLWHRHWQWQGPGSASSDNPEVAVAAKALDGGARVQGQVEQQGQGQEQGHEQVFNFAPMFYYATEAEGDADAGASTTLVQAELIDAPSASMTDILPAAAVVGITAAHAMLRFVAVTRSVLLLMRHRHAMFGSLSRSRFVWAVAAALSRSRCDAPFDPLARSSTSMALAASGLFRRLHDARPGGAQLEQIGGLSQCGYAEERATRSCWADDLGDDNLVIDDDAGVLVRALRRTRGPRGGRRHQRR